MELTDSLSAPTAIGQPVSHGRVRRAPLVSRRSRALATVMICLILIAAVLAGASLIGDAGLKTSLRERNLAPHWQHLFGTDWLGRDMLTRTLHGLTLSMRLGLAAAVVSALIAAVLGTLSATFGGKVDLVVTWTIDLFYSLPHLVVMILIAFVVGGGVNGVMVSLVLTHWAGLARVIRAEVLQVRQSDYVQLSLRMGRTPWWIARHHLPPHVLPQFLVGLILLFPHAILHEAGLSFIGIGLSPNTPAIGIILAEAMRYLSAGYWWLAVMPGAALLIMVKLFDILGGQVRNLIDPRTAQE